MAKSKIKLLAVVASVAALVAIPLAHAAGYFPYFPIVGGASYCSSVSGIGNSAGTGSPNITGTPGQFGQGIPQTNATGNFNAVCNDTVPAGPSALTGNELMPADTLLSQGQQPQTVLVPVGVLGAGPTQFSAPLTGTTVTVAAGTRQVIVNPAGTIAALTLQLPAAASLKEGQRLGFCTTQVVTALTVTGGTGLTVSNAPTAMLVPVATGAASCVEWVYVASATTMFRTQ